ncbi:MAG: protein kinase, partial [Myxococcota bacterium]|nr:protein kinase [Myxococcota bacterium]
MSDVARKGQILLGKYEVLELLGAGGMGLVYRARHLDLKQDVALKFLQPALVGRADAVERFLREARTMARLTSEHVTRVMDVAKLDSGVPYLVMEFLHGTDLQTLIERGPLPLEEAVEYLLQACEAVAEAHLLGMVHRDIKPSNLFLTRRRDRRPLVKVLDFGISKIPLDEAELGPIVTATNAVIGSPRYMSPEQIRSAKTVDARADIWSLGIVLHELVTGQHPFPAETPWDTMAMILSQPPVPARKQRADVPEALEAIVLRCLSKERGERFPDVASFASALSELGSEQARISAERARATLEPPTEERAHAVMAQPVELRPPEHTAPTLNPPSGSTVTDQLWTNKRPSGGRRPLFVAGAATLALGSAALIWVAVRAPAEPGSPELGAASESAKVPAASMRPAPSPKPVIAPLLVPEPTLAPPATTAAMRRGPKRIAMPDSELVSDSLAGAASSRFGICTIR